MFITLEDVIMKKLNAFAKTEEGKKKLAKQMNGKNSKIGYDYAKQLSGEFLEELNRSISHIESKVIASILLKNISVTTPTYQAKGWIFSVNFNHKALYRDSLWIQGYPNGIDLAYLSNNGYHAKNYVYGNSNSKYIRSLLKRAPEEFIQNTIKSFKSKYPNVIIEYNSNYKGGTL